MTATNDTAEVIRRFNDSFLRHEPDLLDDLIGADCVMEAMQPAPDGSRLTGRAACLGFWRELAADRSSRFTVEDVQIADDRAVIRWRLRYGDADAEAVRGVNLMRLRDGLIVEALGYGKTPGGVPLPE